MSDGVTGLRNARRASPFSTVRAQADSCAADAGRQLKIFRRLGVSPRPVTLYGPTITSLLMLGVNPATSNLLTRAPLIRRSTGVGSCCPPPRTPPPPPRPGVSISALKFSLGDVTPIV